MVGDDGRGEETRELQAAVAVGRDHHGDLDALIAQSGDAPGPFAFDHGAPLNRQAKLGEEGDGVVEGFDDDADIVHPEQFASGHDLGRVPGDDVAWRLEPPPAWREDSRVNLHPLAYLTDEAGLDR